jgi:Flp pilus assembly pilin Flp
VLTQMIEKFRNRRGQTMAEYVMIFSVIAVLAFAAYQTLGNTISSYMTTLTGIF